MNKKLILTVGLPRNGKSSWALGQHFPIVNPDDIRFAMHGQPFIASAEPLVWAVAHIMVDYLFLQDFDTVILDSTNTTRKRRDEWISDKWKREFHLVECDIAECKYRAKNTCISDSHFRELSEVINKMSLEYEPLTEEELSQ